MISIRKKHKTAFIFSIVVMISWKIFSKKLFFGTIEDTKRSNSKDVNLQEDIESDFDPFEYLLNENEEDDKNKDEYLSALPGSLSDLSNIYKPEDYDSSGCPTVPIAFSGMTGRQGNVMCVYANFIALQWKLGFKYFLPQYMNHHSKKDVTKPYIQSIFKNVIFPTATWTNITTARNADDNDLLLFNNSRTNYKEITCNKHFQRVIHLEPTITEQLACAENHKCLGKNCLACSGSCLCTNVWVTQAGGANYLDLPFVGDVLEQIIKHHLQFRDQIVDSAVQVIGDVARNISADDDTLFVGVHVRRTDFSIYSKFWMEKLLDETFFEAAMDHFRNNHSKVAFLVVTDDIPWCKTHLTSADTHHVGTPSPELDMAIMANCNGSIIDYGTFGMWGAILAGGETVTSKHTFRDVRWAADYFGWIYV